MVKGVRQKVKRNIFKQKTHINRSVDQGGMCLLLFQEIIDFAEAFTI